MKYVDFTMPIDTHVLHFPSIRKSKIEKIASLKEDSFDETFVSMSTHTGTHIDAPSHFIDGGKKLSDFELSHLFGECIIIDCRGKSEINLDDAQLAEINAADIVFLLTGHSNGYKSADYTKQHPVLSEKSALGLLSKKIKLVGIDAPSIDAYPFKVHKILLKNNILIVENLTNLFGLNNRRFNCFVVPLSLDGVDGSPCRVFAELK